MTSRVRRLLFAGFALVAVAIAFLFWPTVAVRPAAIATSRSTVQRTQPVAHSAPAFTPDQLNQFLLDARQAEAIPDPLQRCLSYPDPPGLAWSKDVTDAYCHYELDPWVTAAEARQLIQDGHAAELDKRLAEAMAAQSSKPGIQGALDRTFINDFKDGSEETRALMDAWKRQRPNSAFALAASGTAYVEMAQRIRGSAYASNTPQDSLRSMSRLLESARTDLDQAVGIDPKLTPAYAAMIYASALEGDANYASSAAKRGLAADPANFTIYARMVWMLQPKWGGSVAGMQAVIAMAQRHAAANPLLKLLLSENTGGEEYVENCPCNPATEFDLYRQIYAEPAPIGMLTSGGWAARKRNSPALSVIYRSQVVRFYPSKIDQRESRGFDLPMLGQGEWAVAEGSALIALTPQNENAYDVRGQGYQATGDLTHATADYEQALRINPSDTWTLARLGDIYVQSNHDWDKGWAVANRLIQASPDTSDGWLLRATIQKNQPRDGLDQTISDFVTRFGGDPAQQADVARMRALRAR